MEAGCNRTESLLPARGSCSPTALQPSSPSRVATLQIYHGKYRLEASRCPTAASLASPQPAHQRGAGVALLCRPAPRGVSAGWAGGAGAAGSPRLCPCHHDEASLLHARLLVTAASLLARCARSSRCAPPESLGSQRSPHWVPTGLQAPADGNRSHPFPTPQPLIS